MIKKGLLKAFGTVLSQIPVLAGTAFANLYLPNAVGSVKVSLDVLHDGMATEDQKRLYFHKRRYELGITLDPEEIEFLKEYFSKEGNREEYLQFRYDTNTSTSEELREYLSIFLAQGKFTEEEMENFINKKQHENDAKGRC